jgi:hypothetical protein
MRAFRIQRRVALATVGAMLAIIGGSSPVAAAPPSNDGIAGARVVGALPYSDGPYSTTEATSVATDPTFCGAPPGNPDQATVWYSFIPSATGSYAATTFGSDYDTTLYVGTSNGAGGINVIGCIDDTNGLQSAVQWDASAGVTYLIAVGTCCGGGTLPGGGGSLVFNVAVAPPAPTVDVTIDPSGTITKYGQITVHGTITCANASPTFVFVSANLVYGRVSLSGFGSMDDIPCDGTTHTWSSDLSSQESKPFKGANISVDAFTEVCGPILCVDAFESAPNVKLRR